jgi:conjugative relaxase-like TrwC/TraI family protein
MLSIAKINAASHQRSKRSGGDGYVHYLGEPTTRRKPDFDAYARDDGQGTPPPFWACGGAALMGLDDIAESQHVERLAKGFHPVTGLPLVKGAGEDHVQGLDMTFSAPKDVSAAFAGADAATRAAIIEALQQSAKVALDYAEKSVVTRHGHAGRVKQIAQAAIAACYTHFSARGSSRDGGEPVHDPQLHLHCLLFNAGKRRDSADWSALELRPMFESKMATGILWRAELAHRLRGLGFDVIPNGPYFTLAGINEHQREELSRRSREVADYMREHGMEDSGAVGAQIASLNTRSAKDEPPLPELLRRFTTRAAALGITPTSVAAMRSGAKAPPEPLVLDRQSLLDELVANQSCATEQEALALICERGMGRWSAVQCLDELAGFMAFEKLVHLGRTELLTGVFTSQTTLDLEASMSALVETGKASTRHSLRPEAVHAEFDRMESELRAKLGVGVSLGEQREAALRLACHPGDQAFLEGWAGTGKTTMLNALGAAYRGAGFSVVGCCQSAAASQNLARETGIPSRTIASMLLSLRDGRSKLDSNNIVVLDEAGTVGREFAELQARVVGAKAKLLCIGDPKQLQPIGASGIFGSLMRKHGKAEISAIQRQRTDFEPLLAWLETRSLLGGKAAALRSLPNEARMGALDALCAQDLKLSRAFTRWRSRFDFEWMREAVEGFAKGDAARALALLDAKGRLKIIQGQAAACDALISAWAKDRTPLVSKAIVAGTRAEVTELNRLARASLISAGIVDDAAGLDVEIIHRDGTRDERHFAPGDRIVFTQNDRALGVSNGIAGTIRATDQARGGHIDVELDQPNERNESSMRIPAAHGRWDHFYASTVHKSQGSTHDAAYVLANPAMADREWTYVAASRSRFATTIYVNSGLLGLVDPESHQSEASRPQRREQAIEALASRMRRSRAKGTTLDFEPDAFPASAAPSMESRAPAVIAWETAAAFVAKLRRGKRALEQERSQ